MMNALMSFTHVYENNCQEYLKDNYEKLDFMPKNMNCSIKLLGAMKVLSKQNEEIFVEVPGNHFSKKLKINDLLEFVFVLTLNNFAWKYDNNEKICRIFTEEFYRMRDIVGQKNQDLYAFLD